MLIVEIYPPIILFCLIGAVCGVVALSRFKWLENRVSELEEKLELNRSTQDLARPEVPEGPEIARASTHEVAGSPTREGEEPRSKVTATATANSAPFEAPVAKSSGGRPSIRTSSRPKPPVVDLEALIGRRFMALAGSVILLAGIAFFLKYAYDCGWIGPSGRLVIGAIFGAGCLLAGNIENSRKLGGWADLVSGLGFAIWYVCIYFAFEIYELWTAPLSFGVASGVTLAALGLAWHRNSWPLMAFALVGGFLSPVLLASQDGSTLVLFGWIALLTSAGLAAASLRSWPVVDVIVLLGGAILYQSWASSIGADQDRILALGFLLLSFVIWGLVPYLSAFIHGRMPKAGLQGLAGLGSAAVILALAELYPSAPYMLGFIIAASALVQFVPRILIGPASEENADLRSALLVQAAIALVTGLAAFFSAPIPVILLAAMAAAAAHRSRAPSCGRAQDSLAAIAAIVLIPMTAVWLPGYGSPLQPFFNAPFVAALCAAGLLALGCFEARRPRRTGKGPNEYMAGVLVFAALAVAGLNWQLEIARWWTFGLPLESLSGFRHESVCLETLVWSILSLGGALVARRARFGALRVIALLPVAFIVMMVVVRVDEFLAAPVAPPLFLINLRTITILVFALVLGVHGWCLNRGGAGSNRLAPGKPLIVAAAVLATLALHLDLTVYCQSRDCADIVLMRAWLVLWVVLVLLWPALHRLRREFVPETTVRCVQALSLILLMVAVPRPYGADTLPLLNIDLLLRALLVASVIVAGRLLRSSPAEGVSKFFELAPHLLLAAAMAADVWTWSASSTAELIFLGPVNQQLGTGLISAVWSLHAIALTAAGFLFRRKELRVLGLAFFGAVMVKVLLVDTGSLPRVHRIMSFIASGVLMLLGSYIYQRVARQTAIATTTGGAGSINDGS